MFWVYPFMVIAQALMYARARGLQRDYSGA